MTRIGIAAGLALAAGLSAPLVDACAETRGYVSTGVEYSTGEYGGEDAVDEVYAPVTLGAIGARFGVWLTVPWLSVTTPTGTVVVGADGQPVVGVGPRTTESGVGDVTATITMHDVLASDTGDTALDLTARVKFGTADEQVGLGTGENDYTVQVDVMHAIGAGAMLASVGYTARGDSPALPLDDVAFGSIGTTFAATARSRIGLFYDYRESSFRDADASQELSAVLTVRIAERWSVRAHALAGFGDSAPRWGAGLACTADF